MTSLSVNRWGFTDKLFEINNCPEEGGFSRIKSHSVRQRLSGIAVWERVSMKNIGLGGLRQGIIRCRAEAGGQGCLCGDGKSEGPDVPP